MAFLECGIGWLPSFLWQMDSDWKAVRYQTPWVKKLPSEYVQEHVRFNSQPLVEPPSPAVLDQMLEWIHADRTLMFGSDFPHFDFDEPTQTFKNIDEGLRRRIFHDNAAAIFNLSKGA